MIEKYNQIIIITKDTIIIIIIIIIIIETITDTEIENIEED